MDINSSSSQQTSEQQRGEPKKKKGVGKIVKVDSSEINKANLAKNRRLVDDLVLAMGPAMTHECLANSLRKFGAEVANTVSFGAVLSLGCYCAYCVNCIVQFVKIIPFSRLVMTVIPTVTMMTLSMTKQQQGRG